MRRLIAGAVVGGLIATGFTAPMAHADIGCPVYHWYNPACNPTVWNTPSWSPDVNEGGKWNPGGYTPCTTPGGCWRP